MPFVHRRSCNQTDAVYFLCPETGNGGTKPCRRKNYVQEILSIIHSGLPKAELAEKLSDYHEKDLADALEVLTPAERQSLYSILGVDTVAEIFTYLDDAEPYLKELPSHEAAKVISNMELGRCGGRTGGS